MTDIGYILSISASSMTKAHLYITYRYRCVWPFEISGQTRITVHQRKTNHWFSAASVALALVSLAVAPVVFGPLGITLGMIAVAKGDRYLGMLGVTASAVLSVTGYYLAGALLN